MRRPSAITNPHGGRSHLSSLWLPVASFCRCHDDCIAPTVTGIAGHLNVPLITSRPCSLTCDVFEPDWYLVANEEYEPLDIK